MNKSEIFWNVSKMNAFVSITDKNGNCHYRYLGDVTESSAVRLSKLSYSVKFEDIHTGKKEFEVVVNFDSLSRNKDIYIIIGRMRY